MKLGFTLDEKAFKELSSLNILLKAEKLGASSIEMSPDKNILPIDEYIEITKNCEELNLDINYHVPYFADNFLYEAMNFNEYNKEVVRKYEEFLSIIEKLQSIIGNIPIIVIHGAKYDSEHKKNKGLYNTLSFLDWILNFVEKKNINIKFAFETLNKGKERVIGDTRDDAMKIIREFNDRKLGICWDICHDSVNYYPEKIPLDNEFYRNVTYCHAHGINIDRLTSHLPIKNSDIKFSEIFKYLNDNKFKGIVNLELLYNFCGEGYLDNLFDDISYLKAITNGS